MKSIEGWYETPAHGAKPSFRAPQVMIKNMQAMQDGATP
jgi:hypothetical protein